MSGLQPHQFRLPLAIAELPNTTHNENIYFQNMLVLCSLKIQYALVLEMSSDLIFAVPQEKLTVFSYESVALYLPKFCHGKAKERLTLKACRAECLPLKTEYLCSINLLFESSVFFQ